MLRNALYAAPAILFGFLVTWSLFSRAVFFDRRWYLRIAIPLVTLACILPTGLGEIGLYFLLSLVTFLLGVALVRGVTEAVDRWRTGQAIDPETNASGHSSSLRFNLRDALWAMAHAAAAMAIGTCCLRITNNIPWRQLVPASACFGLLLLVTSSTELLRLRSMWLRFLFFLLWFPAAFALSYWWATVDWMNMAEVYDWAIIVPAPSTIESTRFQIASSTFLALMLSVLAYRFALPRSVDSLDSSKPRSRLSIAGRWTGAIALAVILLPSAVASVWLYAVLIRPIPQLDSVAIEDNSYNDLVAAIGKLDQVVEPADYETASRSKLEKLVASCRDDLRTVEHALNRPCRKIPNLDLEPWQLDFDSINGARCYARLQLVKGQFHEESGDYEGACRCYMNAIRLGHVLRNGGLHIDALVGVAIEAIGMDALREARTNFDSDTCQRLIDLLQLLDQNAESWDVIHRRDVAWTIRVGGDSTRLEYAIGEMVYGPTYNNLDGTIAITPADARRRLLLTDLAIKAFYLEYDRYPASLNELSGEYLDAVLVDPYSDGPLVYRRTDDGYQLYSVGRNGTDDGGKLVPYQDTIHNEGDFFLDMPELDDL